MKYTADAYFDEYNLQDIQLLSTVGFTDEDVEADPPHRRRPRGARGLLHGRRDGQKDTRQITLKVLTHAVRPNPDRRRSGLHQPGKRLASRKDAAKERRVPAGSKPSLMESDLEVGDTITLGYWEPMIRSRDYLKTDTFTIVGIDVYTGLSLL